MSASPYPPVVLRALAQLPTHLREVVDDAIAIAEPFQRLDAAEASAAEHISGVAALGAEIAREQADQIARTVAAAREEDARRLGEVFAVVATVRSTPSDLDRLAVLLGLDAVAAIDESFDAFMRDEGSTLALTPRAPDSADVDDRPMRIATPRPLGPVDLSTAELARLCRPGEVPETNAGRFCRTAAGLVVLVGDGTALSLVDGSLSRVAAPIDDRGSNVQVARWASGRPSQLRAHAVAAHAVCLAARDEWLDVDLAQLPALLAVGAAIEASLEPTEVPLLRAAAICELITRLRALGKAANANQAAAALVQAAFEVYRLRISLFPAGEAEPLPVVPVGQLRWCTISDCPIVWMPMSDDAPDTVGGADRRWADEAPTGSTVWQANSPELSLDAEWAAALVVNPDDSRLWCVGRDGRWWDLDVTYDVLLAARRDHLGPWLEALEALHRGAAATVARQRELGETAEALDADACSSSVTSPRGANARKKPLC